MKKVISYLEQLKFDPKLNDSLIGKYLRNIRLVILIVIMTIVTGIVSFMNIPRVLNPEIKIPIVMVSTVLPGAGPNDVESLLTVPVEDGLKNVEGVTRVSSTSQNSVSVVTLEFESGVDADKAKDDVQSAVQSITNLPKDAKSPSVQKLDFAKIPVWTFELSGKDPASLTRIARNLRDALKDLPSIDSVQVSGLDEQEIQVLIKPSAIAMYGINPLVLSQAVNTAVGSIPSGTITTEGSSFDLSLDPTIMSIEDLRKLRVSVNGTSVLLSDIAEVSYRTKPGANNDYVADAHTKAAPAVTFNVYKKSASSITGAVADAHKLTDQYVKKYSTTCHPEQQNRHPEQQNRHPELVSGSNKLKEMLNLIQHDKKEVCVTDGLKVYSVIDAAKLTNTQYGDLVRDLVITLVLVFLVMFVFLGGRQAILASTAIPLTFLVTFIVMSMTGVDLSFIAFFSLLLSLGLLVDDTVVVISALTAYYRSGKFTPIQAGLLVWRDFRTAIFTTTLTTVWAFVPLLLATGIIGEFIKPIPIIVSTTLMTSFGVAMFITLPLLVTLLRGAPSDAPLRDVPNGTSLRSQLPLRVVMLLRIVFVLVVSGLFFAVAPKGPLFLPAFLLFVALLFIYFQTKDILRARLSEKVSKKSPKMQQYLNTGVISFVVIGEKYRRILDAILSSRINRRKTIIMVCIFSLFSYLLVPFGLVKNEFFPPSSQEQLYVSVELPAGTKSEVTREESLKIVNELAKVEEVEFAVLNVGQGIDVGTGSLGASGGNTATITLVLPSLHHQKKTSMDIAQIIRDKFVGYEKGTVSVVEISGGPPAGADLQIQLFGSDLSRLDAEANKIQEYLKKQPGVTNVSKSIKPGTSKIVFIPNAQKVLDAGLTQDQVGFWLRTFASGFTLEDNVRIEEGNSQSQEIVFRTDTQLQTTEALTSLMIPTQNGPVSLASLGTLSLRPNPTLITREEGKRTISVSASVTKGHSVTDKNKELEAFADSLQLSDGYFWRTGGVNDENQKSVMSILQAMLLSFMLIIITIVLQFSSFRKAIIVMLVIPLSISGVFIVFAITQTPLSFPALIGILALFGIVVKNSILIVDKINQNLQAGIDFKHAIVDASESRLEPIALTSFTAVVGLIPITLSDPLWQGLGGAIIAGLLFSGSIMLFFIPVMYYQIFNRSEGSRG